MTTETDNDQLKMIIFQLGQEEYAINVTYVQSIERMQNVTRIPGVQSFIIGVMNLRGVITPVIDLRKRFGLEEKHADESTRILMITLEEIEAGLVVDGANDVLDIPVDRIESPPEIIGGVKEDYLEGIVNLDGRFLTLLHLEKVLSE
ncbi:chemotaxis protein CheW [Thalassorhabdus alkalitolerans]|uniref:Chemotaxis protein CheW n=1 Tax=Thalassorhabdus alkalitolerans TaxID=2282697 RepID=A0ABW0YMJ6_9BACI|nr:chemotaxis protein CheW [Thalassobacillus sp. C254]